MQTRLSASTSNDRMDLPNDSGVGLEISIQNSRVNIDLGTESFNILTMLSTLFVGLTNAL